MSRRVTSLIGPRPAHVLSIVAVVITAFVPTLAGTAARSDAAARALRLAAIGDSYASGEGNPGFDAGTGGRDEGTNRCHRGPKAWPRLLGTPASAHFACSGAGVAELYGTGGNDTAPLSQMDRLARLSPAPDVVLVTVGGNDLGFSSALTHCYLVGWFPGSCYSGSDLDRTLVRIRRLGPRLESLYRDIARRTGSRVVVATYPRLFAADGSRRECHWLDKASQLRIVAAGVALNEEILRRAAAAGVDAVDAFEAFAGHELCTKHSMFVKVSPLRGLLAYSAHPNAAGQRVLADQVARVLARESMRRSAQPTT